MSIVFSRMGMHAFWKKMSNRRESVEIFPYLGVPTNYHSRNSPLKDLREYGEAGRVLKIKRQKPPSRL